MPTKSAAVIDTLLVLSSTVLLVHVAASVNVRSLLYLQTGLFLLNGAVANVDLTTKSVLVRALFCFVKLVALLLLLAVYIHKYYAMKNSQAVPSSLYLLSAASISAAALMP